MEGGDWDHFVLQLAGWCLEPHINPHCKLGSDCSVAEVVFYELIHTNPPKCEPDQCKQDALGIVKLWIMKGR